MTFSIAARCPATGMFGLSVSSSSPAVAARCAYARRGVGAAGSQNITDPTLGPKVLDLMGMGIAAPDAVRTLAAVTPNIAYRQLIAVDKDGRTGAFWVSRGSSDVSAAAHGNGAVAAGRNVLEARRPSQDDRGIRREQRSARQATARRHACRPRCRRRRKGRCIRRVCSLCGMCHGPWRNLRVDWSDDDPIRALQHLWSIYEPQLEAYVTRALDPTAAPNFGVPGDR